MFSIKEINNKEEWDSFVQSFEDHTQLQSWSWGEFRQAIGEEVYRFAFFLDEKLVGTALITIERTRYGRWMYVGYGPLTDWNRLDYKKILEQLKNFAKEKKCDSLTVDPQLLETEENKKKLTSEGFVEAHRHIQAN